MQQNPGSHFLSFVHVLFAFRRHSPQLIPRLYYVPKKRNPLLGERLEHLVPVLDGRISWRAEKSHVAFATQTEPVQVLRRNTTQFSEVSAAYHGQSPRQPGRQSR